MLSNHKKHKSHKIFVFVPFVAIPGIRPPAEFCTTYNSSIRSLVFINVHSWFAVLLLFQDTYLLISGRSFSRVAAGMRLRSVSRADLSAERHLQAGVSPSWATASRISLWAFSLF